MISRRAALAGGAVLLGAAGPPSRGPVRRLIHTRDGTRLDCWDTGGGGEAVVLLHPSTGSADVWDSQRDALVAAGCRVVAWSRRGVGASDAGPAGSAVSAVDDLAEILDALGIARCHLVGSAAGGFIVPDAALAMPQRLLTLTIACSQAGIVEDSWQRDSAMLTPPGFRELPSDYRELSPSYRLENPAGRERWVALERAAATRRIAQPPRNRIDFASLRRIGQPTLIVAGDADPYFPPARARLLARLLPHTEVAIIAEAGHSAYWERPAVFNRTLIGFLRRHRTGR